MAKHTSFTAIKKTLRVDNLSFTEMKDSKWIEIFIFKLPYKIQFLLEKNRQLIEIWKFVEEDSNYVLCISWYFLREELHLNENI